MINYHEELTTIYHQPLYNTDFISQVVQLKLLLLLSHFTWFSIFLSKKKPTMNTQQCPHDDLGEATSLDTAHKANNINYLVCGFTQQQTPKIFVCMLMPFRLNHGRWMKNYSIIHFYSDPQSREDTHPPYDKNNKWEKNLSPFAW